MGIASEKIPTLTSATKVTREQFRDRMDVILDRVSSNESVFVIQDDLSGECVLCSSADFAKHRDPDYDAIVLCAVRYALDAAVNGSRRISARGSENFPDHYWDFTRGLWELLREGSH